MGFFVKRNTFNQFVNANVFDHVHGQLHLLDYPQKIMETEKDHNSMQNYDYSMQY